MSSSSSNSLVEDVHFALKGVIFSRNRKQKWTLILRFTTLTCLIIVQQILLFFGEKNTYTTLLGPTRLLIFEIFPSKPDFHLHK